MSQITTVAELVPDGPLCAHCELSNDTFMLPDERGLCEECTAKLGLELCERCVQLRPMLGFLYIGDTRMCAPCVQERARTALLLHESFFKRNPDVLELLHPVVRPE